MVIPSQIVIVSAYTKNFDPVLGQLEGSVEEAVCNPTDLGRRVVEELEESCKEFKNALLLVHVVMPDHVHFILDRQQPMQEREIFRRWNSRCGGIFAAYRTQKIHDEGHLMRANKYMRDNPRRVFIMQNSPQYFKVQRNVEVGGLAFDAVGNVELLKIPQIAVHCRQRWSEEQMVQHAYRCFRAADAGCVMIGPFISDAEQGIGVEAAKRKYPIIRLLKHGMHDHYKPTGEAFYACAEGRLLHLSPWPSTVGRQKLTRGMCVKLNEMAETLARYSISD